MRLPNLVEHDTLHEVTQQSMSWIPLLNIKCHSDTQLFLCSLFSPVCLERPIYPCRSLCQVSLAFKATTECRYRISSSFLWLIWDIYVTSLTFKATMDCRYRISSSFLWLKWYIYATITIKCPNELEQKDTSICPPPTFSQWGILFPHSVKATSKDKIVLGSEGRVWREDASLWFPLATHARLWQVPSRQWYVHHR